MDRRRDHAFFGEARLGRVTQARDFHSGSRGHARTPILTAFTVQPIMASAVASPRTPLASGSTGHTVQPSYSSSRSTDDKSRSTSTRNPISLRLYKVLGTNYDDPATREALETLSELYRAPDSSKGKAVDRELKQDDDELAAMDVEAKVAGRHVLASTGTAVRARKSLRRDAELKLAQGSRQFVRAFQEVDKVKIHIKPRILLLMPRTKHIDVLQEHIDAMRIRCDEAQIQLHATNEACSSLLERAGGLRTAG